MKWLTDGEILTAGRVECMAVAFCGGVVGLLWFWLLDIHPRFIGAVIGASSAGLSGFVMFWAWRERVTIARIEARQQVREPYPWELHDLNPMPDRSIYTVQVQAVNGSSVYIADLTRAHGGDVVTANLAAEKFWAHVSAGKPITNRECEPICGGRVNYQRMRQVLLNAFVIERVGDLFRLANPLPR